MKKTLIMAALCTMCMVPAANANYLVYDPKNVAETIKMVQNTEQILGQVKQGVNLTNLINNAQQELLKTVTQELTGIDKNERLNNILSGALNDVIKGRKLNAQSILTDVLNEGMLIAEKNERVEEPLRDMSKALETLNMEDLKTNEGSDRKRKYLTAKVQEARDQNFKDYSDTRKKVEDKRIALLEETQKIDEQIKKLMEKINDPNTSAKQVEQLIGMVGALNSQKNSIRLEITTLADVEKSARNTYELNNKKISDVDEESSREFDAKQFQRMGQKASDWGIESVADMYKK